MIETDLQYLEAIISDYSRPELSTTMPTRVLTVLLAAANAVGGVAACTGFDHLRFTLNTNQGGVADTLRNCVAPLLFAPVPWLPADQAHEFCNEEDCKRAVRQLKQFPSCTWESQIPSGSDANTLAIAQQVIRDCGGTA